ncbi:MAG TPA: type II toxin-antitoxin system VapC family toxin [Solirubrobacteraceae bacterium]|nr:type II toxin-antitoxin system VapC family toxin [Solirubrobacteraceae bacterium]
MTVLDASGAVDYLLGWSAAAEVERLLTTEGRLLAPDVIVFEVLSALRRQVLRGTLPGDRAQTALADLGDMRLALYPSLVLRERAWELRENMTAADALYVALAERVGEPLASKDEALLASASALAGVEVIPLRS